MSDPPRRRFMRPWKVIEHEESHEVQDAVGLPVPVVNQSGHIGDVARRELGGKESALPSLRLAVGAHLYPKQDASVPRCDISCTTAVCDGGVARRTQQCGQGIPVGSSRLASLHIRSATGSAETLVGRECPLTEVFL
jgi:hypothetical protein